MPQRVPSWKHQVEDLASSWSLPYAALDWEPRIGKSKTTIDTAARLYAAGEIDGAMVIAPNGVHLNWTIEQIPAHWPYPSPRTVEWSSNRSTTKTWQKNTEAAIGADGFLWVAVNTEAIHVERCRSFCRDVADRRRLLLVVDECHHFRNPQAACTRSLLSLVWPTLRAPKAARKGFRSTGAESPFPYRRILSGTLGDSPFDLWSQYFILHPDILGRVFTSFRARVGVFKKSRPIKCSHCGNVDTYPETRHGNRFTVCSVCKQVSKVFGALWDELVEYRNIDKLNSRRSPCTFTRKKAECMDLPERIEVKHRAIMPDAHARVYAELRDEMVAYLDSGTEVDATHALARLVRLRQASRGYLGTPDDTVERLPGPYPAVEATVGLVLENPGKSIVWCASTEDVDMVREGLDAVGVKILVCDGRTPMDDRPALRAQFREDPDARVWLGTTQTGGEGVDLSSANLMIFYSHGFSWFDRVQGLERNYGSNQKAARVDVVDIVVEGSIDLKAIANVSKKDRVAGMLSLAGIRDMIV